MKFQEGDIVKAKVERGGYPIGTKGVIVHVFPIKTLVWWKFGIEQTIPSIPLIIDSLISSLCCGRTIDPSSPAIERDFLDCRAKQPMIMTPAEFWKL